jgi:hypothetical protein
MPRVPAAGRFPYRAAHRHSCGDAHDDAQRSRHCRQPGGAGKRRPDEGEAQIDLAARDEGRDAGGFGGVHGKADGGKLGAQAIEHARQELDKQRVDRGDRDIAGLDAAQIVDLRPYPLEIEQRVGDVAQQDRAGRRRPHAGRRAIEERGAERRLDLEQLPIDGAGGDVEGRSRLADGTAAGDLGDVAQRGRVHRRALHSSATVFRAARRAAAASAIRL